MIIHCSKCGKKFDLDKSQLVKGAIKVRCPSCKNIWIVKAESRPMAISPSTENKKDASDQPKPAKAPVYTKLIPTEDLIVLRAIVGFLGEKSQFGWWDTDFLSPTGLQFLTINFPRSAFSAGCNSVTEAAKRLHDERIGKGSVYHLFRLPAYLEEAIHRNLLSAEYNSIISCLNTQDVALDRLNSFFNDKSETPEGPVQIGTLEDIFGGLAVRKLSMNYYNAFTSGKMCFPYFVEK